jgi:hypothetical protein
MQIFSKQFESQISNNIKELNDESLYDLEETSTMIIGFLKKFKYSNHEKLIILAHVLNHTGEGWLD